jgi:uncharacterized glyoxalase superfamily protein PhnB
MLKLDPYLNFDGTCEEAFNFYRSVFGGEFKGGIMRMKDVEGMDLPQAFKDRVMHVSLPVGNDLLMGSDTIPGMGNPFQAGNNNYIRSQPTVVRKLTGCSTNYRPAVRSRCRWRICSGAITSAVSKTGSG